MRIEKRTYNSIIRDAQRFEFETGGIIGSTVDIIDKYAFDEGILSKCGCTYVPNVDKINSIIESWQLSGIRFQGIYHTHFGGADSLSDADIEYIKSIMEAMPDFVNILNFPVILIPEGMMVNYTVSLNRNNLSIDKDFIQIKEVTQ